MPHTFFQGNQSKPTRSKKYVKCSSSVEQLSNVINPEIYRLTIIYVKKPRKVQNFKRTCTWTYNIQSENLNCHCSKIFSSISRHLRATQTKMINGLFRLDFSNMNRRRTLTPCFLTRWMFAELVFSTGDYVCVHSIARACTESWQIWVK